MPLSERSAKVREHGGQLPVAIHRSVIECGRSVIQRPYEMKRIEDVLATLVTPRVRGNDRSITDHVHAVDIPLHAHGAERPPTRHAVTVPIEPCGLVLVHLGRLDHARIEPMKRHR